MLLPRVIMVRILMATLLLLLLRRRPRAVQQLGIGRGSMGLPGGLDPRHVEENAVLLSQWAVALVAAGLWAGCPVHRPAGGWRVPGL